MVLLTLFTLFNRLLNTMAQNWRDKLLVASIDFGTTFSGYAVSYRHDYDPRNPQILSQPWRSGDGLMYVQISNFYA